MKDEQMERLNMYRVLAMRTCLKCRLYINIYKTSKERKKLTNNKNKNSKIANIPLKVSNCSPNVKQLSIFTHIFQYCTENIFYFLQKPKTAKEMLEHQNTNTNANTYIQASI